jgi:golgi phosphoprotein 3
MLTFAEELLLLSHDEKTGHFHNMDDAMPALAGAVLMELAIRDRIDTDLDKLMVVDGTPTGEPVLDGILAQMVAEPGTHSTDDWVDFLKHNGQEIHDAALARLIERGILRREEAKVLWVFGTRRYPLIENHEQQEVKLRIANLLMSDEIPDARDIVIIALAQSCGLLEHIFSTDELDSSKPRIEQIVRLDLIGQAVRAAIENLRAQTISLASYPS